MSFILWHNCNLATFDDARTSPYGLILNGAMVLDGERIHWIGALDELPKDLEKQCTHKHDANNTLITPGFIDCHTHLVYGDNRAQEFELRLNGASYEEISRQGGGIASTVRATRVADFETLLQQTQRRLNQFLAEGVTTIEIKSGYGLSLEHERKCLKVARTLESINNINVRTTFLGAHAVPPEFSGRMDDYIETVLDMLPVLHKEGLVDAVDAFCERIAFSTAQVKRVFELANQLNLPVKLHAEQLSDSAGAVLAANYKALSCDHLEWLSEKGTQAMANAGSVAVLLPGAFYFLRETKLPPIELLRKHAVPIAISTDSNPGTSPCNSLLLMLNMACTLFRLTPAEALAGVTLNAAKALGLSDRGSLAVGKRADFTVWDVKHPAELCYAIGSNPCINTIFNGLPR